MTDNDVVIILSSDDDDDDQEEDETLIRKRQAARRSIPIVSSSKASSYGSAARPSIPNIAGDCSSRRAPTGTSVTAKRAAEDTKHKSGDKDEVRDASPSRIPFRHVTDDDWDENEVRPLQCKYCNGKFLSTNLFEKHMNLHEDMSKSAGPPVPQYECVICNRRFLFLESRTSHMVLKHADRYIPPRDESGDKAVKRKEPPAIHKHPEKSLKVEKQAKKIRKSVKQEVDEKPVAVTKADVPVKKKSSSVPSAGHSAGSASCISSAAPKINRRPARLNVDFTRDLQTERECSSCHRVFVDPLTHLFHNPCFDQSPFRQPGGYKCPSCPKSGTLYPSIYKLREHSAQHRVPPFACSYCRTRTQLLYEMELHVAQNHSDKLSCLSCPPVPLNP